MARQRLEDTIHNPTEPSVQMPTTNEPVRAADGEMEVEIKVSGQVMPTSNEPGNNGEDETIISVANAAMPTSNEPGQANSTPETEANVKSTVMPTGHEPVRSTEWKEALEKSEERTHKLQEKNSEDANQAQKSYVWTRPFTVA